jgi:hypothetical protein
MPLSTIVRTADRRQNRRQIRERMDRHSGANRFEAGSVGASIRGRARSTDAGPQSASFC